eukprot:1159827-Pelagomonas_calceolata.AAC.5
MQKCGWAASTSMSRHHMKRVSASAHMRHEVGHRPCVSGLCVSGLCVSASAHMWHKVGHRGTHRQTAQPEEACIRTIIDPSCHEVSGPFMPPAAFSIEDKGQHKDHVNRRAEHRSFAHRPRWQRAGSWCTSSGHAQSMCRYEQCAEARVGSTTACSCQARNKDQDQGKKRDNQQKCL